MRYIPVVSGVWASSNCMDAEPAKPKKMACDDDVDIRFWTSSNLGWSKRNRCVMRKCGLPSSSFINCSTISWSPSVKWNLAGNNELFKINAPFHIVKHFLATSGNVRAVVSAPLRRLDESESESGLRLRGERERERDRSAIGSRVIAWRFGRASYSSPAGLRHSSSDTGRWLSWWYPPR